MIKYRGDRFPELIKTRRNSETGQRPSANEPVYHLERAVGRFHVAMSRH